MNTKKKAVNARKAGIQKENAMKELKDFVVDFLEMYTPEQIDSDLFNLLMMANSSPEFDTFTPAERASYLCLIDEITYLMYLIRDAYEHANVKQQEKAAI